MSSATPKILVSRHALKTIKQKNPIYFNFPKRNFKSSEETPWPIYMQIAGYTAAFLTIPYTFSVVVSESNVFRDYLEGEKKSPHDEGLSSSSSSWEGLGRKVVSLVRWYWGKKDHIPYVEEIERLQKQDKDNEGIQNYSMENEDSVVMRINQERIEMESNDDVKVVLESEGIIEEGLVLKGNASVADQLFSKKNPKTKYDPYKPIILTIEDKKSNHYGETKDNELSDLSEDISFSEKQNILKLANIYSMWNYFPPSASPPASSSSSESNNKKSPIISPSKPSSATINTMNYRIEELRYEIADLQKMLTDPMCTRNRDDMEKEVKELNNEISMLRRERRKIQLKKLITF